MQCTNSYLLPDFDFRVPCGKCLPCRIARSREWATRIIHECHYHNDSVFVTLTYNDDFLPRDLSLSKSVFQRFMKRLRKRFNHHLKYYACGEYGDDFGRPHYHAIIFGISMASRAQIESCWPFGFIKLGTVTFNSARYVADYIKKKSYGGDAALYGSREPPFQLQSRGIGKAFALEFSEQLRSNLGATIRGKNVGLPRYYKKVLAISTEQLKIKAIEQNKKLVGKFQVYNEEGIYAAYKKSLTQNERTLKAKLELRKKRHSQFK